ncbi:MAG: DUF1328 domain-containing protein [Thermoplasmatota archaeon]
MPNSLIRWGIGLLIIGLLLSLTGIGGLLTGPLVYIGWILLVVGLVLTVLHFVMGSGRGRAA